MKIKFAIGFLATVFIVSRLFMWATSPDPSYLSFYLFAMEQEKELQVPVEIEWSETNYPRLKYKYNNRKIERKCGYDQTRKEWFFLK